MSGTMVEVTVVEHANRRRTTGQSLRHSSVPSWTRFGGCTGGRRDGTETHFCDLDRGPESRDRPTYTAPDPSPADVSVRPRPHPGPSATGPWRLDNRTKKIHFFFFKFDLFLLPH